MISGIKETALQEEKLAIIVLCFSFFPPQNWFQIKITQPFYLICQSAIQN